MLRLAVGIPRFLPGREVSLFRSTALALTLLSLGSLPAVGQPTKQVTPASASPKRVLLLHSDNVWFDGQAAPIQIVNTTLHESGEWVEVFAENLEQTRLGGSGTEAATVKFFRDKYRDKKVDLVIAVRTPALTFLLSHRSKVFQQVPIVFCMVPRQADVLRNLPPGVTGASFDLQFGKTAELSRLLQPAVRRLVVLAGASQRDLSLEALAKQQLESVKNQMQIEYWEGPTIPEARARLSGLPPGTAALYLGALQDRTGRTFAPFDFLRQVASRSSAAIYAASSRAVGQGAVGGYVAREDESVITASRLALQILHGKTAAQLPPVGAEGTFMFDWRELRRRVIPESRLPAGSIVRFRKPSGWILYRQYVLAVLLALLIQTALLVVLLAERRHRKQIQSSLRRQLEVEQLVFELSTTLSESPADTVDVEIRKSLRKLLETEALDYVCWLPNSDASDPAQPYYALRVGDRRAKPFSFTRLNMPWTGDWLLRGQAVTISHLEDLPVQANVDKQFLSQLRVKSGALVPCGSGTTEKGVLVAICFRREREWPGPLITQFRVLGNIFANSFLRKTAQEAEVESEYHFRRVFEGANIGMAITDAEGRLVIANPTLCSMLGYGHDELSGMSFAQLTHPDDVKRNGDLFQELLQGKRDRYQIEKRCVRKDGAVLWCHLAVSIFDRSGNKEILTIGTLQDITERKAAEEELRSAHRELEGLTGRILHAQEEERQRIARELHDDIGQRLSLMTVELDTFAQNLASGKTAENDILSGVLKDADELASDLHQFSHRLHSSKLQHLGLIAALKDLCRQVSRQHRIAVDLISKDVPNDLPYEVAICFYRIAQEALTNASRHSGANRVTLQISESAEGLLRMQISDAGRGFDPATQSGGLGLASMRERLRLLGGKLRVDSRVGGGTELTAELVVDSYGRRAAA